MVVEGKTKVVYELPDATGQVLLQSKDRITAGDGARSHELEGKAAISTATNCAIFELLNNAGAESVYLLFTFDFSLSQSLSYSLSVLLSVCLSVSLSLPVHLSE